MNNSKTNTIIDKNEINEKKPIIIFDDICLFCILNKFKIVEPAAKQTKNIIEIKINAMLVPDINTSMWLYYLSGFTL